MFSRILIRLIDEAILPAVLLIAAKVLGVVLSAKYFGISLGVGSSPISFYFSTQSDFIIVNSFSFLAMCIVVFAGGLVFLLRSRVFHDTHITPQNTATLFSLKLGHFIRTSFDVYSEGTIWVSYSYLMLAVTGIELYFGLLVPWVFAISLANCVFLTLLMISDVEKEITKA